MTIIYANILIVSRDATKILSIKSCNVNLIDYILDKKGVEDIDITKIKKRKGVKSRKIGQGNWRCKIYYRYVGDRGKSTRA